MRKVNNKIIVVILKNLNFEQKTLGQESNNKLTQKNIKNSNSNKLNTFIERVLKVVL